MGPMPGGRWIAIVDCEMTGLDSKTDVGIELAIMLSLLDDQNEVIGLFGPFSSLQNLERELDPKISLVTGLAAQHLKGRR